MYRNIQITQCTDFYRKNENRFFYKNLFKYFENENNIKSSGFIENTGFFQLPIISFFF